MASRAAELWADHVVARAGANARTVLALGPPSPDAPLGPGSAADWTLALLAVRIDEPTTRLPWASADPALFGAGAPAWTRWAETEAMMLRRAWGTRLPEIADAVATGAPVGLAVADVLAFVDLVAPRLQAAGFDVVAPGGLLRPSSVRRRMGSPGSSTGTLAVEGLGLELAVLVDGEPLSEQEFAALAAAKSELVNVRGRWQRIGPDDVRRLAALARRLRTPATPADLLADEAFDGIELDATEVLPQGLRPARALPPPEGCGPPCGPTSGRVWTGWRGWPTTASAGSSPTTWVWARPCRY